MNTTASPLQLPLDQPLPADVIAGMTWGPFRYRKYPVFSWPWLKKRFWFQLIAITGYAAFAAFGQWAYHATLAAIASTAGYFIVGTLLMFTVGPALATRVRHWRSGRGKEGRWVIAAVVLGVIASLFADAWASRGIKRSLPMKEVKPAEMKIGDLEKALLVLAGVGMVFVYFGCGGGFAALAYFSERRRLRARGAHLARLESDMRLSVLQAQIEPHFLFNTLACIRPLIRQDAARAEAAIDAVAQHLRDTIPQMRAQAGTATSTLGQQVDICASYLAVMQIRLDTRLQSEIAVPLELRGVEFPPLLLLSLVENAIKHGLEPKPEPGWIRIQAEAIGARLQVTVSDDGVGLKEGLSTGLGLANIREQLAVRFAGQASLSVLARPEGGTVAGITVPLASPAP